MDYGMAGNMRMNVAELEASASSAIKSTARTSVDSQVGMLEHAIGEVSHELEEERTRSSKERSECAKLLKTLDVAERELVQCRKQIEHLEQRLGYISEQNRTPVERPRSHERKRRPISENHLGRNAQHDSTNRPEVTSPVDDMIQETLEEQSRLILLITTFEDREKALKKELRTAQKEASNNQQDLDTKKQELDVLRGILRGSGLSKTKKETDDRPPDSEMEKKIKIKDAMIKNYTIQVTDLQTKAKKIPHLTSQLSKLENLNSSLISQGKALATDMKSGTKLFEQKEGEMRGTISRLESVLNSIEADNQARENTHLQHIDELVAANEVLDQSNKKNVNYIAKLKTTIRQLDGEAKDSASLRQELAMANERLERDLSSSLGQGRVHSRQGGILGILFCIDMGGSLAGDPARLAKDLFRKFIEHISTTHPTAHVGIIVQASSVYTARFIAQVDSYTGAILDPVAIQGTENYSLAFSYIAAQFMDFKTAYPQARRHVVMISDGEDLGAPGDVSALKAEGIPCHNIVVGGKQHLVGNEASYTEKYSSLTGGKNSTYDGCWGPAEFDLFFG